MKVPRYGEGRLTSRERRAGIDIDVAIVVVVVIKATSRNSLQDRRRSPPLVIERAEFLALEGGPVVVLVSGQVCRGAGGDARYPDIAVIGARSCRWKPAK